MMVEEENARTLSIELNFAKQEIDELKRQMHLIRSTLANLSESILISLDEDDIDEARILINQLVPK